MKKKISSVLLGVLLVFAGVFMSACGDKYKKMEFKISYAFSENATNWYDANGGINLNYSVEDDEYVFVINGNTERVNKNDFNIFIKVEINGVKSKHLGAVTVYEDSDNIAFTSANVNPGSVVKMGIIGTVDSQISFYENESGKSTKINISIDGKLNGISANENVVPTVVVGKNISLNSLSNLIIYNPNSQTTTNQIGVKYEFVEFGTFEKTAANTTFKRFNQSDLNKKFVSLNDGVLKINSKVNNNYFILSESNNVVKLKATSVHDENISTEVFVYLVENNLENPIVKFNDDNNFDVNSDESTHKGVDLYFNVDENETEFKYASTSVVLSDVLSVYNSNNLVTANGKTLTFKPVVYVGDNLTPYDFESSAVVQNNLILQKDDSVYTIKMVNRSSETKVNLKFAYELVCEDENVAVAFTQNKPQLQTNVEVRKHVLTSAIVVNGSEYKDETNSITGDVYSTLNPSYMGYEINLKLDPIDSIAFNAQTVEISFENDKLSIKDASDQSTINSGSALQSGKTLYVKFKNGINEKQTITLKTKITPEYFNGAELNSHDYKTVTLTLEKKVTADSLQFVNADDYSSVKTVDIASNKTSSVFVKVGYSGSNLDLSTVKFASSNYALNDSGDTQVSLTDAKFVSSDEGYNIYKLNIPATNSTEKSTLTVYAGELNKGASAVVTLNPVNVITDATKLKIVAKDDYNVKTFDDNKFAVVKDRELDFNVFEVVNDENVSNTIKNLRVESVEIVGDNADYFGGTEVLKISSTLNSNALRVQGWQTKTRVVNVVVEYYALDNDAVKESSTKIENVQFAVYSPIDNIVVSLKKDDNGAPIDEVVYVNTLLNESNSTEITYTSCASSYGTPTQNVYFVDSGALKTIENVSSVDISIGSAIDDTNLEILYKTDSTFEKLTKNKKLKENADISSLIRLQLKGSFSSRNNITFTFTAKRFNKESVVSNVTIKFVQVDKAIGIDVTKGDIVSYSSTNNELQLSFMDAESDVVSKSFSAKAKFATTEQSGYKRFDNLTYQLYKYSLKNGEVEYELDGKTPKLVQISNNLSGITVEIKNNQVTVSANKTVNNVGGLYKLVIATTDSYNDNTGVFKTTYSLNVRVSDGEDANSAYIISNATQFAKINNSLDSYYVLGDNITLDANFKPIGRNDNNDVTAFTGSLSGKLYTVTNSGSSSEANYSIYVTIKNCYTDEGKNLYGLFTMLDEGAKISDLNVNVEFATNVSQASSIGGLVAINNGTIERVNVYPTASEIKFGASTNFGAIAGENRGIIKNCKVVDPSNGGINITASMASNIGLVAGTNSGTITGAYNGKESLNSINFDVVANLKVCNTQENVQYNIGGVAGQSTDDISNMLVGGQIVVTSINITNTQIPVSGYLGGIVGQTTDNLSYVGALGLDLNNANKDGIKIAGIAGRASIIDNARFISASSTFSCGKMLGEIVGSDVAGISFNATVKNSTVESFISTVTQSGVSSTFYTLSGNNVYGMINSGSLTNSFVSANLEVEGEGSQLYLTSNVTDVNKDERTYFIGQIKTTADTTITKNSTYSVVYSNKVGGTRFVSITGFDDGFDATSYVDTVYEYTSLNQTLIEYLKTENCLTKISAPTTEILSSYNTVYVKNKSTYSEYDSEIDSIDFSYEYYALDNDFDISSLNLYYENESSYIKLEDVSVDLFDKELYSQSSYLALNTTNWNNAVTKIGFGLNSKINLISFATGDYAGIEWYFPYLTDENKNLLMIEQPTSLSAEINQDYKIENEKNVYVDDIEIKEEDVYNISESVVVDFFANNYSNYTDVNTHYLVDTRCDNCKNGDTDDCTCSKCADNKKNECTCHNGLLELKMLPVTSGLVFEIIGNGSDYATIIDNEKICFVGASNGKPIIVKAYSVFNTDVKAYVAFYSQQTYSKLTLEGTNVSSSNTDDYDYEYRTYKGKTSGLITLAGENIIGGTTFDSLFDKGTTKGYISVEASFENDKLDVKTETLSTISIKIKDNYTVTNGESSDVTLKVYLKADYFGTNIKTGDILLGEVKVKVLMSNVADGLTVSGADSFEADSSSTITIQADLKTGFVDANDSTTNDVEEKVTSESGNIKIGSSENKDSIYFTLSAHGEEIERIKSATGVTYIVDLFDFDVYSIRTDSGYRYYINLSLKDEHDYRYLTQSIKFGLTIWAKSNPEIQNSVEITIKPTTVSTLRITNYAVNKVNVKSDTKSELTIGNVESSIIAPGGRGNIMVVYAEKSYANIEELKIESSTLYVPSLGRDVNLIFTQMVYNTNTKKFETLFNSSTTAQNGTILALQKATTINGEGKTAYTGQIYIHAQLVNFAGLEAKITATLNVTSNSKQMSVSRDLSTTFLPGATLSYNGIELGTNKYLVQDDTYGNVAKIKLYGYEFNSNPIMHAYWELTNGVDWFYVVNGTVNTQVNKGEEETDEEYKNRLNTYLTNGTLYYSKDGKYYKATSQEDLATSGKTFYSIINRKTIEISGKQYNIDNYVNTYIINDYDKADYNSVDGSYTLEVKFNIAKDIPTNFSLSASLSLISKEGNVETAESDAVVFCPSKYVVTDVKLSNTSGNKMMLAINNTNPFEFIFSTLSDYDYSSEIYEEVFINQNLVSFDNLASLFEYYDPDKMTFKDENSAFTVAVRNNYLTIVGLSKFEKQITLKMTIGYTCNNGKYEIVFGNNQTTLAQQFEYAFTLQIYPGAGEENATPIYNAYEMFDDNGNCLLSENAHYILMDDITLEKVKPIEKAIGSLDGNNHIIKIKDFVIDPSKTNYGLFATLGTYQDEAGNSYKSILKNVIVDYSEFNAENSGKIEFTNNNMTSIVFGGLVANNNGGLIYNSDVISSSGNKTITITTDDGASLTFGGLVGINSGKITNSRVGRSSLKVIDAKNDLTTTKSLGSLTFVLGSESNSGFDVTAGGFVGENSGDIASSYFANSNLINYSNSEQTNLTAGFVGNNSSNASVMYSYVKGKESTINSSSPNATGAKIEGKSNSIVAGFVYQNAGNINDCYSNIELHTKSTYMAGFVYTNTSGTISECYAACTMETEDKTANDDAEQPFVGKNNEGVYLDKGTIENVYYLISDSSNETGSSSAQALNSTNFKNKNNLTGFVFVESNVKAEREQGVWSYYDLNNNSLILPELMNANTISHSAKYLISGNGTTEKFTYTNADSYLEGTKNNPYIIRSVSEYNDILTGNRADMSTETSKSGYIRFIDDIDFSNDNTAIKTRVKYTLGDDNRAIITSVEGNGMSISGIYFDAPEPGTNELGLFAKIKNAYVKNLTLNFVSSDGQYSTTSVKYSGGLAGKITDSAIINVTLDGRSVSLSGENYVGGLAGLVDGSSLLYGINSNLSVEASSKNSGLYYSKTDYVALGNSEESYNNYISNLSYAGGLAGVIDITKRTGIEYNVAFINIHGDEMNTRTNSSGVQLANISGEYAGGVAGYASRKVNALKLKYFMGSNEIISGDIASAGVFAVSLGSITATQVTAEEAIQHNYDDEFGDYVINITKHTLDKSGIGNLKLIQSNKYAGGLIGIGLISNIDSSYSRASFVSGEVVGGLIGASVGSSVTYSYAVPYININSNMKYVGGLIGQAYFVKKDTTITENSGIREYEKLTTYYLRNENASMKTSTDIQYTFSSILMDKSEFVEVHKQNLTKIDYVSPSFENNSNTINITSGEASALTEVYVGDVDYSYVADNGDTTGTIGYVSTGTKVRGLNVLYDLEHVSNEITYNEIFKSWNVIPYWTIKNVNYFAWLTSENTDNYIEIASADDFKMIASNPDGKYRIVKDINLETIESNWVIATTFTGVLTGKSDNQNESRRTITVTLQPDQSGDSTGFFKETKGAEISNINIKWEDNGYGAIDTKTKNVQNFSTIAGLSCLDGPDEDGNCSTFENIQVIVPNGYLVKTISKEVETKTFAGLVASTESSLINSCKFAGKAEVTLTAAGDDVYFGGLVGVADKSEEFSDESMSIMSSTIGASGAKVQDQITTAFKISVGECGTAFIGGAIAKAEDTAIYSVGVGGANYEKEYKSIKFTIANTNSKESETNYSTYHIGGLIGNATRTIVTGSNTNTDISVSSGANNSNYVIGGLIAQASQCDDDLGIKSSNASTNINLAGLQANTLHISAGVAWLNESNIEKCLFTGEIVGEIVIEKGSEKEYKGLAISTIYAGGAVAFADGSDSKISETMSNANITVGSSAECSIYAGGFVGFISQNTQLTLSEVVSTGKLVPISDNKAKTIHISAMAGSVNGTIIIKNSYTLTSVIADAISGTSLQNTSSDVLIGYPDNDTGKAEIENVYFSTDISLTTNDKDLGTNISAYALTTGKDLSKINLLDNSSGKWREISTNNEDRLPYLTNLEDSLKIYGILEIDGTSKKYDYVSGTVLRPIQITGTNYDLKEDLSKNKGFNYYIITNSTATFATNSTLNGVLIGHDDEIYTLNLITKINRHSAVSNLHINYLTNSFGIAETNNGLIFNCSVQGEQLNTGSTSGLIANINNGTIAYCYSSAEVKNADGNGLAGIAGRNNGVINSCYFTGFIKNNESAGITLSNGDYSYIYNSYMAGVIAGGTFSNTRTSFSKAQFNGLNNYVDMYANIEGVLDDKNLIKEGVIIECTPKADNNFVLKAVNTANLMATTDFNGVWYQTVREGKFRNFKTYKDYLVDEEGNFVEYKDFITQKEEITGFGYNYGYPIYNFNKYALNDLSELELADIKFSLYSGTGEYKQSGSLADRYDAILGIEKAVATSVANNTEDYNTAYKIPHLGVLSAVQGLLGKDRNYVVIYSINGLNKVGWTAVGSNSTAVGSNSTAQGFAYTGNFKGLFVTNAYLSNSYDKDKKTVEVCTIQGLTSQGLFNNIEDAYFADIVFGYTKEEVGGQKTVGLTSSGPLGVDVIGNTTVKSISYAEGTTIYGENISALFGKIGGEELIPVVTIANFKTENAHLYGINNSDYAGLIASEMASGSLVLINQTDTTSLNPYIENVAIAGGLVGKMTGGYINGNKNVINTKLNLGSVYLPCYGGIVGEMSGGEVESLAVMFIDTQFANIAGGLVGKVTGQATFRACSISATSTKVVVSAKGEEPKLQFNADTTDADNKVYIGLLAGCIGKDIEGTNCSLTVENLTNKIEEIVIVGSNTSSSGSGGIGGLVGYQNGNLIVAYNTETAKKLKITAQAVKNVGGIIGHYAGGEIGVYEYKEVITTDSVSALDVDEKGITICGYSKVGGFIGKADAFPSIKTKITGVFNFLTNTSGYATIIIPQLEGVSDFGGIFGELTAGNATTVITGGSEPEVTALEAKSETTYIEVGSHNTIQFENGIEKNITVSNIGGVVGSIVNTSEDKITLGELTNNAKFVFGSVTEKTVTITGLGGVVGSVSGEKEESIVTLINLNSNNNDPFNPVSNYTINNIGGLIGQNNTTLNLEKSTNNMSISDGTSAGKESQSLDNGKVEDKTLKTNAVLFNVGGLIGLNSANKSATITSSSNTTSISGYQNVGGLVGYAGGETSITGGLTGTICNGTTMTESVKGNISGVINVGGAVGYLGGSSTIQHVGSTASIYANTNGGGLVGLANSETKLTSNMVELSDTDAQIKALYYNYHYKESTDYTYITYIPTSFGGLIGASNDATITNCVVKNVTITSAEEGKEKGGDYTDDSKGMISTVSNYMVATAVGSGANVNTEEDKKGLQNATVRCELDEKSTNKVSYNALSSGFGGFVGTMGSTSTLSDSYLTNIKIEAQLGVNVGTYYGVVNVVSNVGSEEKTIKTPFLSEKAPKEGETFVTSINGAYNIGGVAGKVSGNISNFGNDDLDGNATINLQSGLSGMYVGGLFGEVVSTNVSGLEITNNAINIKLDISSSYYIGGLVGKLTVNNPGNTFKGSVYKTNLEIVGDATELNFGGLVGMLKCQGGIGTYKVEGNHDFYFTVNTIENQNYEEGTSTFNAYDLYDSIDLSAQAYYINQDSFIISATQNDYYQTGNSPLRTDGKGWAKEYTGFKQMQRCIPQDNRADWDSIAIVYNAENVSHVATVLNSIKSTKVGQTDEKAREEYIKSVESKTDKAIDENYIIYTIYDAVTNRPLLYSAVGIAELLTDDEGNNITTSDSLKEYHFKMAEDDITYVGGEQKIKLTWPWCGLFKYECIPAYSSGGKITNEAIHEMEVDSIDMIKFDWTDTNLTFKKEMIRLKGVGESERTYQFSARLCHINIDGKYYLFKTIYANDTLNGYTYKYDNKEGNEQTFNLNPVPLTPESGSVFAVCGVKNEFETFIPNEGSSIVGWIVASVIVVVVVVLIVLTIVTKGTIWVRIGKAIAKIAVIVAKFVAKHAVGTTYGAVALGIAIAGLVVGLNAQHAEGKEISSIVFFNTTGQNFGLLTNTSVTDLQFDSNGQWIGSMADCITLYDVDGAEYTYNFYSNQRPSDYYSSYYCAVAIDKIIITNGGPAELITDSDLTIGYAKNNPDISPKTESGRTLKYLYVYKAGTTDESDVYLKYIYHEGKYYSNNLAISVGMYETNELSNLNTEDLQEYEIYYDNSGIGYIAGNYSGGVYKFKQNDNNLVRKYYNGVEKYTETDEDSTFKINGVEIRANAYVEKLTDFYFYDVSAEENDGYEYIKGAYYARYGTQNALISEDEYAVKYAKFTYSLTKPDGTEGVDYVRYTHYYNPHTDLNGSYMKNSDDTYSSIMDVNYTGARYLIDSQEVFFEFEDSSTATEEDTSCLGTIVNPKISELESGTIILKVYPYSLYNPYTINKGNAPKDSYVYKWKQNDGGSGFSVKAKVRYYYYDGGYEFGANILSRSWAGYNEYKNSVYKDVTNYYKMSNGSYLDSTYTAYDTEGNEVTLTYEQIFNNEVNLDQYYITDITADDLVTLKEYYKLKYQFVKYNDKLYELDSLYMFNSSTGKINKLYAIVSSVKSKAYIQNKYLLNKDHGLYSVYRYRDSSGNLTDLYYGSESTIFIVESYNENDEKINEYYYVIPNRNGQRLPNGRTTRLVESCKVSLGGGYSLSYTNGNKNITSGTFTIS